MGCGFGVYRSLWLSRSFSAIGTIDSVSEVVDQQNSGINYAPTFTFSAADGKEYTVTSGVASNPPDFEVGEHVRVRYLPNHPKSAEIDSFWQLWLVSVVCGGLGAVFTTAGYLLFRYERRRFPTSFEPTHSF